MLEKKIKLKRAMENLEPKNIVKDLFLDYDEAFKRLRNPSNEHYQEYKETYLSYVKYLERKVT